ncbi:MAG: hypothetical protein U0822_24825 [Anaerolineae bacterium]
MRILWLVVLILAVALLFVLNTPISPASGYLAATPTGFPVYMPALVRQSSLSDNLPPPVTPVPILGYVCRRTTDPGLCWNTTFTLNRGPGTACGRDMSVVYYLTSDTVSLDPYEGLRVRVFADAPETIPGCPVPLLHVLGLVVPGATPAAP